MTVLAAESPHQYLERRWAKPLAALALSVLLHFALLGVPVNLSGGMATVTSMITARLEPAPGEAVTEAVPESPPAVAALDTNADKSAIPDALPTLLYKKVEPKPASKPAEAAPASPPGAGIELPFIRDPTYYPIAQVDVWPKAMVDPERQCPPAALANRVEGFIQVLVLIDEFGVIDDATVVKAEPEGYFEEYTLAVLRPLRWYPAQKQGRAVKSRGIVRWTFSCTADAVAR